MQFIHALMMREGLVVTESPHPSRFRERPLRFFGLVGLLFAGLGLITPVVLLFQRIDGVGIANRPALLLGTRLLALGAQAIALGLVAEITVHPSAPTRRSYRLARETEVSSADQEQG